MSELKRLIFVFKTPEYKSLAIDFAFATIFVRCHFVPIHPHLESFHKDAMIRGDSNQVTFLVFSNVWYYTPRNLNKLWAMRYVSWKGATKMV